MVVHVRNLRIDEANLAYVMRPCFKGKDQRDVTVVTLDAYQDTGCRWVLSYKDESN